MSFTRNSLPLQISSIPPLQQPYKMPISLFSWLILVHLALSIIIIIKNVNMAHHITSEFRTSSPVHQSNHHFGQLTLFKSSLVKLSYLASSEAFIFVSYCWNFTPHLEPLTHQSSVGKGAYPSWHHIF